ncbi:MAG: glycoside hydrolase family 57 protein [Candidatus Omnitrophota bacterium]|jgi:alpha-amylase/alpha-mannosidase (GH57 family)
MAEDQLHIAFVWHMHQPYYRNPLTGEISMPWVRLHAVKDYLDMALMLRDHPGIHQTFNMVPSLLEQIEDLSSPGSRKDLPFELTMKPAKELTEADKLFILRNFFMANWDTMIKPFPRYYDLLVKRGKHFSRDEAAAAAKRFTPQDYTDLQVLFNLSWIDPFFREKDAELKALSKKGKYYTDEDKAVVLDKQMEIMRAIIPAYRKLQDEGIIEVSVSPYFHPILPLLCDTDIAKTSYPEIVLPKTTFRHPEDAKKQVESAVRYYEDRFGRPPRGMWPSEGSVSDQAVGIISEAGLKWAATDEEVLFRSLQRQRTPEALYRPYSANTQKEGLSLIFRDRTLSDAIGFVYQSWPPENAAADFIGKLHAIKDKLPRSKTPYLVPVILDGENAWEFYPNDGRDFLRCLYRGIQNDPGLRTTTVSGYLEQFPAQSRLERIHPGSWINGNFNIWIGHEEKNKAWEYLFETREMLKDFEKTQPDQAALGNAWKEIFIAEGSDWNWWYGEDNSSANDDEFDRLFRMHLSNVYSFIGKTPPEYLSIPIRAKKARIAREPAGFMNPVIDGRDTNYFEWVNSGLVDVSKRGGTMHQSETILKQLYFGFNKDTLFFRFDLSQSNGNGALGLSILLINKGLKISVPALSNNMPLEYVISRLSDDESWSAVKKCCTSAFDRILEIAVKFDDIEAARGETLKLIATIDRSGAAIEHCPEFGAIQITLPSDDYESQQWNV